MSSKMVSKVTFLRTVECQSGQHYKRTTTMYEGYILGNVNGHLEGIRVSTMPDGTLSLFLPGPDAEWFHNVPADSVKIENLE